MSVPTRLPGKYKIGSGGYGKVYRDDNGSVVKHNIVPRSVLFSVCIREGDLGKINHPYINGVKRVIGKEEEASLGLPISPIQTNKDRRADNLHFVFEEASCDLHDFLFKQQRNRQNRDYALIIRLIGQLLQGLDHLHHDHQIIHRDIKPANILYFQEGKVKISDFGLAIPFTYQGPHTPRVVTCLFRPPEVMIGESKYNYTLDVWSLGCTVFQMIALYEYINNITEDPNILLSSLYGNRETNMEPDEYNKFIAKCQQNNIILNQTIAFPPRRKTLRSRLAFTSAEEAYFEQQSGHKLDDVVSLLRGMLTWDYRKRWSARQCLAHPLFDRYRNDIINLRNQYPRPSAQRIYIIESPERFWMREFVMEWFGTARMNKTVWFRPRIIFQAVDLFDRYCYLLYNSDEPRHYQLDNYGGIDTCFYDRFGTRLRFVACIYICYKYFLTLRSVSPFKTIMKSLDPSMKDDSLLPIAEGFEIQLLTRMFPLGLYRPTIYEAPDYLSKYLDSTDYLPLMKMYLYDDSVNGSTPYQLINYYFKHLKKRNRNPK